MSSNVRTFIMLCVAAFVFAAPEHAPAVDWSAIWKRTPKKSRTRQDLDAARTLALGEFTGATAAPPHGK